MRYTQPQFIRASQERMENEQAARSRVLLKNGVCRHQLWKDGNRSKRVKLTTRVCCFQSLLGFVGLTLPRAPSERISHLRCVLMGLFLQSYPRSQITRTLGQVMQSHP